MSVTSDTESALRIPGTSSHFLDPTGPGDRDQGRLRYVTAFQVAPRTRRAMADTRRVASTDGRMEGVQIGDRLVLFGRHGEVRRASPAPAPEKLGRCKAIQSSVS